MNLLKLTIANGPSMGGSLYLNKDKICGFTPVICLLGPASEYGKEKGSNVLMECHRSYEVEEKVEDICKMLESSNGYLQITSMPKPVMNNIEPVIKTKTTFDVEIYDRTENDRGWRGDEYGFESLKEAKRYIKSHTINPLYSENYRIVQRDTTVKTSVV